MADATDYHVTIAHDGDLYFGTFSVDPGDDPENAALRHCKEHAQGYGDTYARSWEDYESTLDGACYYPVPPLEAAAPIMLAALLIAEERLRGAGMLGGSDDPIVAAIAKARGAS